MLIKGSFKILTHCSWLGFRELVLLGFHPNASRLACNNVVCVYFHKLLVGPPILQQETVLYGIGDSSKADQDHRVTSLGLSFRCTSADKTCRMEFLVKVECHYHDGAMFAQDAIDLLSIDKRSSTFKSLRLDRGNKMLSSICAELPPRSSQM